MAGNYTRKYNHYLYDLILHLKTNAKKFSESLGHTRTDRIYNVLKETNKVSADLANEIIAKYPFVSYEWLISGNGKMLVEIDFKEEKDSACIESVIKNRPHDEQMEIIFNEVAGIEEKIQLNTSAIIARQDMQDRDVVILNKKIDKQNKMLNEIKEMLQMMLKNN